MPIKIRCVCGNVLLAPEERIGQTGRCPNCNRSILVEFPDKNESPGLIQKNIQSKNFSKGQKKKSQSKKSFLVRLLGGGVYLILIFLLVGVTALHYFPEQTIQNFATKPPEKVPTDFRGYLIRFWWKSSLSQWWNDDRDAFLMIKRNQNRFWLHLKNQFLSKDQKEGLH